MDILVTRTLRWKGGGDVIRLGQTFSQFLSSLLVLLKLLKVLYKKTPILHFFRAFLGTVPCTLCGMFLFVNCFLSKFISKLILQPG